MKKLVLLAVVAAVTTGVQAQNIISWNENNGQTIPATGVAGVVAATNWNNSINGISLNDESGASTGAAFTIGGTWGVWGIAGVTSPDGDGTYNRAIFTGYANTSSGIGPETFSITGIPYLSYDLIVYFSSDAAARTGTINDANAALTYDFSTMGLGSFTDTSPTGNAVFTQTTDTGGSNPDANYAIFSDLTGSSDTLTLNIANGGGIAGFQIVAVPEPGTLALASLGGLAVLALKRRKTKVQ